jgi:hypothetical protein
VTEADEIWNRACFAAPEEQTRPGDRSLSALLRVHGEIMNGGMHFAVDQLEPGEIAAACDGFAFFDRSEVADVLTRASAAGEDERLLSELEDRYYELVPDDSALVEMFEARLAERPGDFAPPAA